MRDRRLLTMNILRYLTASCSSTALVLTACATKPGGSAETAGEKTRRE